MDVFGPEIPYLVFVSLPVNITFLPIVPKSVVVLFLNKVM